MSLDDDPFDDVHRFDRDDELFDRLLDGDVSPDDAPPALAEVAALVQQAGGEAAPGELADEDALVAAMAAVLPDVFGVPRSRRTAVIHRLVRAKVATIVVVSAVGIGAAAAAVSTVRDPERPDAEGVMAQGAATTSTSSTTSTTLVVTVPTTPPTTAATTTVATSPPSSSPTSQGDREGEERHEADEEVFGLCNALHGTDDKLGPPALAKLEAAAAAAGKNLTDFCTDVLANKHQGDDDERQGQDEDHRNNGGDNGQGDDHRNNGGDNGQGDDHGHGGGGG